MMTDGSEERQFLHAEDCSECLYILSKRYNEIPRNKELHITSFEWSKIINIANKIASIYSIKKVISADSRDDVQKNYKNEPDPYILKYWKPKLTLGEGIEKVIRDFNL